ncbi:hypothetical protein [Lacimicrobium alkaliphilum]|uniref:Uncharacterized protein n=1 Tax=Lacimicrobium alkaliphilum TaxID=1526571 RepID=A0A0U3B6R0_9ALTE|nr:hypothetical protein [Lacimicrobium alkaliphilum]ALS97333.1 hypothetical protein AT746_02970 [Lacimicrobium alkaliphilum]
MNSIDMYLRRVNFWLSHRDRESISSSIREALEDQVQAKEIQLGRQLTDTEISQVVKQFGPPALAASRYKLYRPLIAGSLMLVFLRIISMGLMAILLVQGVLVSVAIVNDVPIGEALVEGLGRAVIGFCIGFTLTTLVFAWLTRIYPCAGDEAI